MKLVTFAQPMSPYAAGEKALVPDDVAARLDSEQRLSASEQWPSETGATQKPVRKMLHPSRAAGRPDQRMAK